MVDNQIIGQQAQIAANVGLLNWLIVAIVLFCGALVGAVMWQNGKREERYAKLVEKDIVELGNKIESYKELMKEKMSGIELANRSTKEEHQSMIGSLNKVSETLISLAYICKVPQKQGGVK